ncbi:MAG: tetratricopeptide repeat protein, partial [Bacteroidota bacterium]
MLNAEEKEKVIQAEGMLANGDVGGAEQYVEAWLTASPDSPFAKTMKGRIMFGKGERAAGKALVKEGVENAPESAWIWSQLGSMLRDEGDWKAALEGFQKGLAAEPSATVLYADIGDCHALGEEYAEAAAAYRKVLDNQDNVPRIHYMY